MSWHDYLQLKLYDVLIALPIIVVIGVAVVIRLLQQRHK